MSNYIVKKLQYEKAKKLGLEIKPSSNKKKKLDVFNKKGEKIASIGGMKNDGTPYNDFATYLINTSKKEAEVKRKNYLKRHSKEPKIKDNKKTNSYYADKILW